MSSRKSKSSSSSRRTRTPLHFEDEPTELFPSLAALHATASDVLSPADGPQASTLDKQLELARLEKEKLTLELQVLSLRANAGTPPEGVNTNQKDQKKRSIDWPQDFIPGSAGKVEFVNLGLPEFVAGFLCMVKKYDDARKGQMHVLLELLMIKAIDYSWASVRGFYGHLAKLIESRRLEWDAVQEIREISATFFKHSDLKLLAIKPTTLFNANVHRGASISSKSTAQNEVTTKSCQTWNYTGTCACDKSAATYEQQHFCRVCKATAHPMLHCSKRRMAIPSQ